MSTKRKGGAEREKERRREMEGEINELNKKPFNSLVIFPLYAFFFFLAVFFIHLILFY